ncbi:MAG: type I-B CRISPR-associated protein Cas7/Csh2 [Deltaproteobacteria bacterium]|nr:type I-B CRISPR-associated protein Cas7/Csh2 [Deltaproteobacteria bacterium]MBW1966331.1 type I-B CRISPR-associated protein Cas7/Csh2 [Deltaproteobacteria bacterium]MBW2097313.1 type I-B CRISPR-associated protein Cas7/Csh2 [Deltaproteobacteria bacterium]
MTTKDTAKPVNNSDILFIYDAKMCNPNGDPDDENKPRMDYDTETNLVSDVRLKRYIRDYLENKEGKLIFVSRVHGKTVDATQRLAYWISQKVLNDEKEPDKKLKKKAQEIKEILEKGRTPDAAEITNLIDSNDSILDAFLDVRLFGATMPIKGKKGESFTFTGPVQFNWGYSLNRVRLMDSATISSTFAGRTSEGEDEEHGTFGKDYRVYYSLIAFHGIVSGKRAEHTRLTDNDIKLFEKALIKSIPLQATRSKIGQYPRMYVRIEYTDQETLLGDLRRFVRKDISPDIDREDQVRDISEVELNIDELVAELKSGDFKDRVKAIHYWHDKSVASCFERLIEDDVLKKKLVAVNPFNKTGNTEPSS